MISMARTDEGEFGLEFWIAAGSHPSSNSLLAAYYEPSRDSLLTLLDFFLVNLEIKKIKKNRENSNEEVFVEK